MVAKNKIRTREVKLKICLHLKQIKIDPSPQKKGPVLPSNVRNVDWATT